MDVLSYARAVEETGPLCAACLGRPVADRSFGLTNADRGRALRTAVALAADEPFEPPEECWVCEGVCWEFDAWADRVVDALAEYEFATYQVGTRVPPLLEENERLLREEAGLDPDAGEPLKRELNREVGKRVGERIDATVDFDRPDVQVLLDLAANSVHVQVNSALVYGRYRKQKRDIPQTEWPCRECDATGVLDGEPCDGCDGTGYRYDESVEQLTAPVVREAMEGREAVFHGAGREDVDALMLGTGRPFVIEVKEPRTRNVDLESLQADIEDFAEGKVEVEQLHLATHEMVERVKELDASKTYRMTVEFDAPVTAEALQRALADLDGSTIEQRTPNRVAHRRGDIVRTREVYDIDGGVEDENGSRHATDLKPDVEGATADGTETSGDREDEPRGADQARGDAETARATGTTATIDIHGEGGLYVKELVSGDEGRTEPSLAGRLGVDCTVQTLDVLTVEGEDEPFIDDDYLREA